MGNCGSALTCPSRSKAPVNADPGIAGVGVLASFFATALLTFGAIVLGYLTDSLPEHYLTTVDHDVIESVAKSWIGRWSVKAWRTTINVPSKCFSHKIAAEDNRLSKPLRTEALKNFILTLSDQQLVTGIAVLIGGFGNWCTTSVYEMNVIVSLAWFSSATHLATLDVLRDYFQENRVVRNCRVFGMILIMLLLSAGLILAILTGDLGYGAPLACLSSQNTTVDSTSPSTWNQTADYKWSGLQSLEVSFEAVGVLFTLGYLLHGYIVAILRTMVDSRGRALTPPHVAIYLGLRLSTLVPERVSMEMISNALLESRKELRTGMDRYMGKYNHTTVGRVSARLTSNLMTYYSSYLSHIAGLSFGLSYGIAQLAYSRWMVSLEPGSNRIDFGQIVPLILLALPILAAAEIFHRTHDETASTATTERTSTEQDKNATRHSLVPSHGDLHASLGTFPQIQNSDQLSKTINLPAGPDTITIGRGKTAFSLNFDVGFVCFCHAGACMAVGILLNVPLSIVVIATFFMTLSMSFTVAGSVSQAISAIRKLREAVSTKTLDKYRHGGGTTQNTMELRDLTNTSSTGAGADSRVSHDSPRTAQQQSVSQDRQVQTDPHHDDDDSQVYASPVRQDTESGLRRQGTSTGLENDQHLRAR